MRIRNLCAWGLLFSASCIYAQDSSLSEQAAKALRKAVGFFRTEVSTEGGYLWRYSEDLSRREGERKATSTQVWVQPPGTPSVGMAYLMAYEATGDSYYLDAARETAHALVRGQLRSGGWDYHIEFDPRLRRLYAYRVDGGSEQASNVTNLDDNTTQSALRLLMRVDKALGFKDEKIHEAAMYALNSLLKAQYPNGAWPQRYDRFPDPAKFPVKRAGYPQVWSRTWPNQDYRSYYTFNDNTIADMVETMLEAAETYGDTRFRRSAERAGDFILLAQMPDPQPGWAQQYDVNMHPAWARRFEPPAISGGESQGVMLTLLLLYRETGNRKYLKPLPRAIEYFRRSALPDGRLARFYELKTNRPLYFTRDYKLTYEDSDLPSHYGFKVANHVENIAREYERVRAMSPDELKRERGRWRQQFMYEHRRFSAFRAGSLADQAKAVMAALDERGRWVEEGRLRTYGPNDPTSRIIDSFTFIRNVETLCSYLKSTRQ